MKLRGDEAALILAGCRMPRVSGIEFLEQAMQLYPLARRVLLTAYAGTGAAIDAINVVDLDHYLPGRGSRRTTSSTRWWTGLLEEWRSTDRRPVRVTKVAGHRQPACSSGVRDFLARNQVARRWYNSDGPDGRRLLAAAGPDLAAAGERPCGWQPAAPNAKPAAAGGRTCAGARSAATSAAAAPHRRSTPVRTRPPPGIR